MLPAAAAAAVNFKVKNGMEFQNVMLLIYVGNKEVQMFLCMTIWVRIFPQRKLNEEFFIFSVYAIKYIN